MSSPIVRLGDTSDHGGFMVSASGVNLDAEGLRVAINGDLHQCPLPGHGTTPVTSAAVKTRSGGQLVLVVGSVAGCGATINAGAATVRAT